tara:strand:- start:2292 stop:4178 length:1887 start_codon:yes stop_codon:yes gene_type:complete
MIDFKNTINNIVDEWSNRVYNGQPDFKDPGHILTLREVLTDFKFKDNVINELINNIIESNEFYAKSKSSGKVVKFLSKDSWEDAIKSGSHEKVDSGSVKKKSTEKPSVDKKDDGNKSEKPQSKSVGDKTPPQNKSWKDEPETGDIAHDLKVDADKKTELMKLKKIESLSNEDDTITDKQLMMTKTDALNQALSTESKDVGAGTAESRAGEAMVHKGLRMLKDGKSVDEIRGYFDDLVNSNDHVLNSKEGKKWVGASLSTINRIDNEIGIDNIKTVSWDTKVGRQSIGVDPNLETSSDMFVQTNEGNVIGLSLKKSGAVFLANKGWAKESKRLLSDLKDSLSPEAYNQLDKSMSIQSYNTSLSNKFKDITSNIDSSYINDLFNRLQSEDDKIITKYFGSSKKREKYFELLRNPDDLLNAARTGNLNGNQKKVIAKLTSVYDKDRYNHLRRVDSELTGNTFKTLNNYPEAKFAMKKHIVKSMHISETLSLNENIKQGGVSGFMTLYGIEPDGAVLNEEKLVDLFGSKFASILGEVRAGTMDINDLENVIMESIEMDYETGNILFKHENNKKYPLFFMKARTRGIGASPTMEMAQTPLMAYALKMGTFNSDKWPLDIQQKFKKHIISAEEL